MCPDLSGLLLLDGAMPDLSDGDTTCAQTSPACCGSTGRLLHDGTTRRLTARRCCGSTRPAWLHSAHEDGRYDVDGGCNHTHTHTHTQTHRHRHTQTRTHAPIHSIHRHTHSRTHIDSLTHKTHQRTLLVVVMVLVINYSLRGVVVVVVFMMLLCLLLVCSGGSHCGCESGRGGGGDVAPFDSSCSMPRTRT